MSSFFSLGIRGKIRTYLHVVGLVEPGPDDRGDLLGPGLPQEGEDEGGGGHDGGGGEGGGAAPGTLKHGPRAVLQGAADRLRKEKRVTPFERMNGWCFFCLQRSHQVLERWEFLLLFLLLLWGS